MIPPIETTPEQRPTQTISGVSESGAKPVETITARPTTTTTTLTTTSTTTSDVPSTAIPTIPDTGTAITRKQLASSPRERPPSATTSSNHEEEGAGAKTKPSRPTSLTIERSPSPQKLSTEKKDGSRPPSSSKSNNNKQQQVISHDDEDGTNPLDFTGSVDTTNLHTLPSAATIRKLDRHLVLDRNGKSHTFRSIYTGRHVARRVLVIFVRHFYCGNCQQYLSLLARHLPPQLLLGLPIPTFIVVIGCGDAGLIDMYTSATNCPFPVYSDPTRKLYEELGMIRTLAMGQRPAYMQTHILKSSVASVVQGLKQIKSGLALKGGDSRQIGGEFLFEPLEELPSPVLERKVNGLNEEPDTLGIKHRGSQTPSIDGKNMELGGDGFDGVDKVVTWCHRMKNTRDHAELPELMEVLGIEPGLVNLEEAGLAEMSKAGGDGGGVDQKEKERRERALKERKGTGFSVVGKRMSGVFGSGGGEK
ncbi:AhpC/TSA antioxidant enzyme-domain-containing protein [Podospora fimiseda]|uniref:AhpC/TSA antioxidant enzyme-domain-containing protein n=1 Tax=Podospora fimiseda TaxID=252190 RepID=A0AAN7BUJ6_9PEZI|nr:AhpC/TSA antioxidant enzyme-domain-containing protein [Podospora fimiseda]